MSLINNGCLSQIHIFNVMFLNYTCHNPLLYG